MTTQGSSSEHGSVLAINALSLAVFTGAQILSRLTSGSLDTPEVLFACAAFVVLAASLVATGVGSENGPNRHRSAASRWSAVSAQAVRVKKPTLLIASIVFALIPRMEAGGYQTLGLAARLLLGAAVVTVVADQADRWLLGVGALTIVLHPWNHPTSVTVLFVGLIMLGIALRTRADLESSLAPQPGNAAGVPLRPRPARGVRPTALVVGAIALSLLVATLLRGQAKQLAWSPNGTSRTGGGLGSSADQSSPTERFQALNADSQLDLAYKPTRSTQEIMTLFTNQPTPAFLRAQTFDRWTGKTWKASGTTVNEAELQAGIWLVRPSYQDELNEFVQQRRKRNPVTEPVGPNGVRQMVIQTKVLFNGYTPVPIEPVAMAADSDRPTTRWQSDGTIISNGAGPSVYVVINVPSTATTFDMTRADLLDTTNVSARTKALAEEIVAGLPDNAAKASAISAWVTANIRYDLSVTEPPSGVDPIEELLFRAKAGSCTHFATATAALLRSVGIPARVATGFVGQTRIAPNQISVQAKDAHAWAEIPLVGGGWRVTDTTLGATEIVPTETHISLWLVLPLVAGLVIAGAAVLVSRRRQASANRSTSVQVWDSICSIGRTIDRHPDIPVSYRGYARVLDDDLDMNGELAQVGARLDRHAFGPPHDPDSGHLGDAELDNIGDVLLAARSKADAKQAVRRAAERRTRRSSRRHRPSARGPYSADPRSTEDDTSRS